LFDGSGSGTAAQKNHSKSARQNKCEEDSGSNGYAPLDVGAIGRNGFADGNFH
jgi:hypothetical protein